MVPEQQTTLKHSHISSSCIKYLKPIKGSLLKTASPLEDTTI